MFSMTMMASSIRSPTERVRASIVMLLKVNPKARIRAKVAMIEIGRATALISVVRTLPRKMKTARIAKSEPRIRCFCTSAMERRMKTDWSMAMFRVIPGGRVLLIFSISCLDRVDDGHGVRPGLLLNTHRHGRNAIEAGDVAPLLHPVLRPPDVPEADRGALVVGDDQVVEIGDVEELPLDLDRVLFGKALDPPPRQLDVLPLEGAHDVARRNPVGLELAGVEPDADLA